MISRVEVVAYGREATAALAGAVDSAQRGSPLAPVTVVVPSNFAGLTARRLLGSGRFGLAGLANVSFVTPLRLADCFGGANQSFAWQNKGSMFDKLNLKSLIW